MCFWCPQTSEEGIRCSRTGNVIHPVSSLQTAPVPSTTEPSLYLACVSQPPTKYAVKPTSCILLHTSGHFEFSFCHPQVSVLTTLERRFNLQSADVGVIASSFEIGNLALILFVSYFGARGHRPRLIGCGGIVMALGALLSALPEFLTHQYKYEAGEIRWGAEGRDVCATNGSSSDEGPDPDLICRNRTATNMMYLLLIGAQVLLGIGATPVQPLGVSYIDDHVRRKDSSLYIGRHCPCCLGWCCGAKLDPV